LFQGSKAPLRQAKATFLEGVIFTLR